MSVVEEYEYTRIEDRGYYWCVVDKTLEGYDVVEVMKELSPHFELGVLPEGVLMDLCYRDGRPAVVRWYFPKDAYPYEKFVRRKAVSLDQAYRSRLGSLGISV